MLTYGFAARRVWLRSGDSSVSIRASPVTKFARTTPSAV